MVAVESSWVKTVTRSKGNTVVTTESNEVYVYFNVPMDVHLALLSSESKGSYICKNIKPKYTCAHIGGI